MSAAANGGPLSGLRVIEIADFGPVPFAAMMLNDMGADVVRIARPGPARTGPEWITFRGRPSVTLDLKAPDDVAVVREMMRSADAVMEGFRPGVMERLGLGPEVAAACNPALVYCRATGWGQSGPLAKAPGHDLNYIAITGVLEAMGTAGDPPPVPLNILGDFAGGAMFLLVGLLAGILEARRSGRGQEIDSAMSEGASHLASFIHYMRAAGRWQGGRGGNLLDGGAPFYNVYTCADGKYVAVGAIEPQFFAELCRRCGIKDPAFQVQYDRQRWPEMRRQLTEMFKTKTRDEWCELLEGTDACVSPVLDWDEASAHPQNQARLAFVEVDGVVQPAPSPRFSRSTLRPRGHGEDAGADEATVLARWGIVRDAGVKC